MTKSWPYRLARAATRRPGRSLAAAALLVLAAAPGLARLKLRTDGHALVPADDPVVRFDAEVKERFGLRDPILVVIESRRSEGIYNLGTLTRVQQISDALAALPAIGKDDVTSLATERRDRVFPGTLSFRPYLNPLPDTPKLMEVLRGDIRAAGILTGTLVSADGRATAILVGAPPPGGGYDRTALYRDIRAIVAPYESATDRILVVGAPVAEALLGSHILADLEVLLPLAVAVIALVIWLGCRRLAGVGLALVEVGACLVFTFGLMGWCGVPVYLTTAVLPVILTTIGLADEIHIFWHYQRLLAEPGGGGPHPAAVLSTFAALARPVLLTSLTTAFAFLSFLASGIDAVRYFGLFAAVGITFCLFFSLAAVPAALTLLPPDRMRHPRQATAARGWTAAAVTPLLRHRFATLAVLGLVTVGLGLGIRQLTIQDSWIDGFAPGSSFRRDTERVNELLDGTHVLIAHLTFDPPEELMGEYGGQRAPLLSPPLLNAIGDFEAFLRRQPGVGGVLGTYSHLSTVAYLWLGRQEGTRRIPDDPHRVDLVLKRFKMGRGEHRLREVIDPDLRRTLVDVFLKDANYRETARLMAAVRAYEKEHLAPLGARVDFAGDVAVSQAMIPAIVHTQVTSLLLALGGALLAVVALTRSLATGLLAVLPATVAVVWVFGFMGWTGIYLGVATSMFCAITLGIGVDYAIHLLECLELRRQAGDPAPVAAAVAEAGPAIVADTTAIALGFGLLTVSRVPANAHLGLLVALALVAGCVLTLAGLGALLHRGPVPAAAESRTPGVEATTGG
jgi:uncharacterized protein